jgi:uncharacterized protein
MNNWKICNINIGEKLIKKITVSGLKPGPHIHIQASVHGAEVMGNKVIQLILDYFRTHECNGKITFIPHANPYSKDQKSGTYTNGRFCPITGENWNRIYTDISKTSFFKNKLESSLDSYKNNHDSFKQLIKETITSLKQSPYFISREKELGLELQYHAADSDIFLDFHTGPIATDYLYVSERQKNISKDLPLSNQILIPNIFDSAGDEAYFSPWVALEEATNSSFLGGEAYTVELGSEETIQENYAEKMFEKIFFFFKKRKVINCPTETLHNNKINFQKLEKFKTYYCKNSGLIHYLKKPGESINKNETLYKILDLNNITEESNNGVLEEVLAVKDGIVINHSPSANMLQGTQIYQILEN